MAEVTLRALADFSYATRRLKAGDTFTASSRDAKVLVGIRKAAPPREPGKVPAPPKRLLDKASPLDHDGNGKPGGSLGAADHMRALREEYTRVVGKRPFSGWDEATLRAKMAACSQS